jgi:hypothetical protein
LTYFKRQDFRSTSLEAAGRLTVLVEATKGI